MTVLSEGDRVFHQQRGSGTVLARTAHTQPDHEYVEFDDNEVALRLPRRSLVLLDPEADPVCVDCGASWQQLGDGTAHERRHFWGCAKFSPSREQVLEALSTAPSPEVAADLVMSMFGVDGD